MISGLGIYTAQVTWPFRSPWLKQTRGRIIMRTWVLRPARNRKTLRSSSGNSVGGKMCDDFWWLNWLTFFFCPALKYHPDRNPGKELDFVTKFQSIQAAHEILSDPQQRLKYDTERLRAGYGKYYAAPKANTSRKAPTSHNSTSSSKPPPFYTRPQSFQNGPSSGAQRYASYARRP